MCYGIAAENSGFENTWEGPVHAGIGCIAPAALPEVGLNAVELPPTNCHLVTVGWIDCNRGFVRGVAKNVVATCIDIGLITGKHTERRNHAR